LTTFGNLVQGMVELAAVDINNVLEEGEHWSIDWRSQERWAQGEHWSVLGVTADIEDRLLRGRTWAILSSQQASRSTLPWHSQEAAAGRWTCSTPKRDQLSPAPSHERLLCEAKSGDAIHDEQKRSEKTNSHKTGSTFQRSQ